jgi:hypothetical protein
MPLSREVRKERRERLKAENRQRWEENGQNANVRWTEAVASVQLDVDTDVAALDALREIMLDGTVPLFRRMKAASAILRYEVPPGALSGKERDDATSGAYKFFRAVVVSDAGDEQRQFALEQMLTVENQRAKVVDADALAEEREVCFMAINAARRAAAIHAHTWVPETNYNWWLTIQDDVDLPPEVQDMGSLDEALALGEAEIARRAQQRQAQLLQVEARNRDDRSWRVLLKPPE